MADITNLFKATVKTVKSRNKVHGNNSAPDKSILSSKNKTQFATRSRELVSNITKLKEFLEKHRKEYINAGSHLGSELSKMTDAERDQIDADAELFMRTCSEAIKSFKEKEMMEMIVPQGKEHRECVFSLIEGYLKAVCQRYSEQRAIRVKRVVDRKRIARLHPETSKSKLAKSENNAKVKDDRERSEEKAAEKTNSTRRMELDEESSPLSPDETLSPEEAQMFEQENQQLYQEMNSIVDEVKHIEGKVVEISRLQEIFTEKVLEQEKDIDRIADTVVGTTENIKEANEEIREAMKNNAGFRVWILFFVIVSTFSLLFLDWYNA